jgi:hypothetical protein
MNSTRTTLLLRATAWGAVVLASLGVLLLYTRPDFLVMVADQVWACF